MMAEPICATCKHYEPWGEGQGGQCRRYAPRPSTMSRRQLDAICKDASDVVGVWPSVDADDFCGEFSSRFGPGAAPDIG